VEGKTVHFENANSDAGEMVDYLYIYIKSQGVTSQKEASLILSTARNSNLNQTKIRYYTGSVSL
jgi:hypothetical protein